MVTLYGIFIKSISIIFPTAFVHCLCVPFLILTMFQTFHYCYICYSDL